MTLELEDSLNFNDFSSQGLLISLPSSASTVQKIKENILKNLDDEGIQFFTDADITDSLIDGYAEVCSLTECVERSGDVLFESNKTYYNLAEGLDGFLRVVGVFNNNTKLWLDPASILELAEFREDWELATGEPRYFSPISQKLIAVFPRPVDAVGNMTVLYKSKAPILNDASIPEIPEEHLDVLEYYATQDLLDQIEEYGKSLKYMQKYQSKVAEIIRAVNSRTLPDKLHFLKAL